MQIAGCPRMLGPSHARGSEQPQIPDANRRLAEAHIRYLDRDDRTTFTTHQQLVAGGRIGARDGYATLVEAVRTLQAATAGETRSAAAVLERAGRFYGHVLKGRDLEQGLRAPLRRLYFEADRHAELLDLRVEGRLDRLRALVDGAWVRRFRS